MFAAYFDRAREQRGAASDGESASAAKSGPAAKAAAEPAAAPKPAPEAAAAPQAVTPQAAPVETAVAVTQASAAATVAETAAPAGQAASAAAQAAAAAAPAAAAADAPGQQVAAAKKIDSALVDPVRTAVHKALDLDSGPAAPEAADDVAASRQQALAMAERARAESLVDRISGAGSSAAGLVAARTAYGAAGTDGAASEAATSRLSVAA
ncbi:hypothetical protein [Roseivivax sp. CAU 1761]